MHRILPALRVLLFALLTLSTGLVAGCGLKGDLVLPDPADTPGETEPARDEDDQAQDAAERQR